MRPPAGPDGGRWELEDAAVLTADDTDRLDPAELTADEGLDPSMPSRN